MRKKRKKTVFATKESFKMHSHSFIFAEKVFAPSLTFVLRAETRTRMRNYFCTLRIVRWKEVGERKRERERKNKRERERIRGEEKEREGKRKREEERGRERKREEENERRSEKERRSVGKK